MPLKTLSNKLAMQLNKHSFIVHQVACFVSLMSKHHGPFYKSISNDAQFQISNQHCLDFHIIIRHN